MESKASLAPRGVLDPWVMLDPKEWLEIQALQGPQDFRELLATLDVMEQLESKAP